MTARDKARRAVWTEILNHRQGTRIPPRYELAGKAGVSETVICFGAAMCQTGELTSGHAETAAAWTRPGLTRREAGVLAALRQPALAGEVFCQPAMSRKIAPQMGVAMPPAERRSSSDDRRRRDLLLAEAVL